MPCSVLVAARDGDRPPLLSHSFVSEAPAARSAAAAARSCRAAAGQPADTTPRRPLLPLLLQLAATAATAVAACGRACADTAWCRGGAATQDTPGGVDFRLVKIAAAPASEGSDQPRPIYNYQENIPHGFRISLYISLCLSIKKREGTKMTSPPWLQENDHPRFVGDRAAAYAADGEDALIRHGGAAPERLGELPAAGATFAYCPGPRDRDC
jgi:hypothetical protein